MPQTVIGCDLARGRIEAHAALSGATSPLVQQPPPQNDPRQRRPDIARADELLDWAPGITLEAGLPKTITYFRALLP